MVEVMHCFVLGSVIYVSISYMCSME